jgi:arginase family enzyme
MIGYLRARHNSRLTLYGGYNVPLDVNPFDGSLKVVDCGDIPVTPYDNRIAIKVSCFSPSYS